MSYQLGIDVGGTRYHLRGRPEKGRDVDFVVPSPGNLHALGVDRFVKELSKIVREHKKRVKSGGIQGVCIGISGLDDPAMIRRLHRAFMKTAWWKTIDPNRRLLTNDIQIGRRAGTEHPYGIALISGTGSNGYAVDHKGAEAWVSGRGHLMADEGSGYALGLACLHAVRRAEDGRGPATLMQQLLFRRFQVESTAGLMDTIYDPEFGKRDVAALNDIVEEAARRGDRLAGTLLDEAAHALIEMATTLHGQLQFGRDPVEVVLIGGTINRNRELLMRFLKKLRRLRWAQAVPLSEDPVEGALRLLEETGKLKS